MEKESRSKTNPLAFLFFKINMQVNSILNGLGGGQISILTLNCSQSQKLKIALTSEGKWKEKKF